MLGRKTVLLVGNDADALGRLELVLRNAGYDVHVTPSEEEAQARAAEEDCAGIVRADASAQQLTAQLDRQIDLLNSVTRNTQACLVYLDREFNFVWVNSAYAEKCGYPLDYFPGKNHFDLYPHAENQAIFERVRDTREPYEAVEKPFDFPDHPEWGVTYWNWTLTAVANELDDVVGLDFSLVDVTDEVRSRKEVDRLRAETQALLEGSRAVLRHSDFERSSRAIFDACKALLGATAGYVALLSEDGAENELVFLDAGGAPCSVDPKLPMPVRGLRAEAYRTAMAVYENDFASSKWMDYIPDGHARLENVLFAPLIIEGSVVGIMGLANKAGGFTENDARMASAFGELAAVSLANSRVLESLENSEERFRAVAQTATDAIICIDSAGRITFWNQAAEDIFGYSAEETMGQSLGVIMPERFREAHAEGIKRAAGSREAGIVGKTVELSGIRRDGTEFPLELSLAKWTIGDGNYYTGIVRDITARKEVEIELARIGEALEAAYRREHRIADTLQRALIPEVAFALTGYELLARYKPALEEAEVGGDFYDVFHLRDGRLALAMGDVSGKGLQAAVHTAMAKYMLRAYAYEDADPSLVLARLNECMCHYTPDDIFVTVFYGVLDHEEHTLTYGSAGHDGPLVYNPRADGVVPLDSTGCVAGVFSGMHFGQGVLRLKPGDVILVYTDGITEARSNGRLFGLDGLAQVFVRSARGDHTMILDAVFEAAIEAGDGSLRDDAAVLVIKALDEVISRDRALGTRVS